MIQVAVGIILNADGQILITQRPLHTSHGGCWEFPGGKLEANELAEHALIREIKEEVDLDVLDYQFLGEVNHQYSEKSVQLLIFLITKFSGKPFCVEGQLAMKWINLQEINPADFPKANHKVIALLESERVGS